MFPLTQTIFSLASIKRLVFPPTLPTILEEEIQPIPVDVITFRNLVIPDEAFHKAAVNPLA